MTSETEKPSKQVQGEQRRREHLRAAYRPANVRVLFIGESPPASGRFFYNRDSGLYRALRDTFHLVDPSIGNDTFLSVFQRSGCYLIDACQQPVDRMDRIARRSACMAGETLLSRRIRSLEPETIVTLVRSISANVKRATARANWTGAIIEVPYPGRWVQHRQVFQQLLLPLLEKIVV